MFLLEKRQILKKKINGHIFAYIYLFFFIFYGSGIINNIFFVLPSLTHVQQVVGISYK